MTEPPSDDLSQRHDPSYYRSPWLQRHLEDQQRDVMRWEGIVAGLLITLAVASVVALAVWLL